NLRMQVLLVLDHHRPHHTGRLVNFPLHGYAGDHVPKLHSAASFRQDRHIVRIPLHESVALLHWLTVAHRNHRTDNDVVTLELPTVLCVYRNGTVFIQDNKITIHGLNNPKIVEVNVTIVLGFDDRLLKQLSSSSPDVERTHGQLRTRLTDTLCGNDPNRFP